MSAKLKLIERKMGLVPKSYQPMSPGMERIARQQDRAQAPAPVPDHGLGATIERLICDEVERRVGEAEDRARQQRLLDRQFNAPAPRTFEQIPPTPRTQPQKAMEFTFQRDELRRIAVISVDGEQWRVQRGAHGEIVRMIPADVAPMPPTITPPYKAAAREYDPGTER